VSLALNRREFIQAATATVALSAISVREWSLSIVVPQDDPIANGSVVRWAISELQRSLAARGVSVVLRENISQTKRGDFCILAASAKSSLAAQVLGQSGAAIGDLAEALAIAPASVSDRRILLACGNDERGLVYALLELADRVQYSPDALAAISITAPVIERPANAVRSVLRLFASDVEDKPWYNDREMWPSYLTMLATQRFNRFNLSLGLGYDFLRQVTDAYFLFAYPFLVSVPGYQVRATPLPDAERDRNLEMLKFISEQTVARGLQFQLGLWMHGIEWIDSPHANYRIEGLTRETHGAYCRDALRLLLQRCPAISGVTIRTHGESGVEEGSYDFWKTIFEGVATCGRKVEIDLHPKGLDQTMLDNALATRQPVTVSPKFWAEHLGMPYHQADIRATEIPPVGEQPTGLMKLSTGSRSFLRYGYGDLLREDRNWRVIHRVWPGSQRLLLWGDPSSAAAYSRAFQFCRSDGAEICEPLTFKGRRGSGIAGDRCAYKDAKLRTRWDWEKYLFTYRVWGRLLYNPDCSADVWRRYLTHQFSSSASEIGPALANASRILPIITTAHCPSAANNNYWPEMYLNHSLIDAAHSGSYSDTPAPKVFGNVSPLDPQLFSRPNDFADEFLSGKRSGKYSPIEVAQWLDDYADAAAKHLAEGAAQLKDKENAEYRRLATDVSVQAGLGHFFAAKFRAAVLFRVFEKTEARAALEGALDQYRKARAAWAEFANLAKDVYISDITVGELPQLHGHWLDRLKGIDQDIAAIAARLDDSKQTAPSDQVINAIKNVLERPRRQFHRYGHTPPPKFTPGQALTIELAVDAAINAPVLLYRHVNQAERFHVTRMTRVISSAAQRYRASIPAAYTDSVYPLEYYFEVVQRDSVQLYPGFSKDLTSQPYFVVRRS
jgi:hypothetical protein